MKRGIILLSLAFLLVTSLVLSSCGSSTTTSTTNANTTTSTSASTTVATTPTSQVSTTVTTASTTIIATATSTGNWWNSLGTPQYGGVITVSTNSDFQNFDPYNGTTNNSMNFAWQDQMFTDDWTLNPQTYNFQLSYRPPDYAAGDLAQSWEFSATDINTFVVTLKKGINFQDIAPVYGRAFTSADVIYSYDRILGLGDGFTTASPYASTFPFSGLKSITAVDNYTVSFTWAGTNPESIAENMEQASILGCIVPSEEVTAYGNTIDWHHQAGTGPFILTDFVDGSAMTLVANTNYWGKDERYPQNRVPYVDGINILIIPNSATTLAAMRTGKIDFDNLGLTVQSVQGMQKTNPDIKIIPTEAAAIDILPKDSIAPFNNINVRIAMQEALDLPTIATSYYQGNANPDPQTLTSYYITGWGFPYSQWPASLQAEYAYNPTNAKALLAAAGFSNGFSTTLYFDSNNDVDLLNIVQSYEAAIGINITLQAMPSATISAFIATPQWTGLAQRSNGLIGRTLAPLRVLAEFTPGNSVNFEGWNDPAYTTIYNNAMTATNIDSIKQYDQQANQYVAQQHILICLDTPTSYALVQPWLMGYNGQNYAFSNLIQTYGARCWINQSVKSAH